jgi:hypothetical protein
MGLDLNHFVPCLKDTNEYLDSISVEKLNVKINYTDKFKKLICTNEFDENEKIIYFKSLGYQSWGMNKQFYNNFTNDSIYFRLEDVEKAYQFLTTDQRNKIKPLQKNFRDNFINNFIEGESIFHVSW